MTLDLRPLARLASADGARLAADCPRVAALLPRLAEALESAATVRFDTVRFDLAGFDPAERILLDDIVGRGEVSARLRCADGRTIAAEEAVMAGLWRLRIHDDAGQILAEALETGPVPGDLEAVVAGLPAATAVGGPVPDGAESAQALLAEIAHAARSWQPGQPNYALTIAPPVMPDPAVSWLRARLGSGPAELLVRTEGGECRVAATATRAVWSVRYLDGAGRIQLDSLEIGSAPATICATAEDRRDSAARLRQIASAYFA